MSGEQFLGLNRGAINTDALESNDSASDPTAAVAVTEDYVTTGYAGSVVPAWAVGSVFDRLDALGECAEPACFQRDE
jgi:predicted metalloprotease